MKSRIKCCVGIRSACAFVGSFFPIFLSLHFLDIGLSGSEIGILFSLPILVHVIFSVPLGGLSDIFSVKRFIQFGIAGIMTSIIGLKFFSSFIALLFVFVLGGIGGLLIGIGSMSYLLKSLSPGSEKDKEMGTFVCVTRYASAVGILVGGALLASVTFDTVFTICAVMMAVILLAAFAMPEVWGKVSGSFDLRSVAFKLKERKLLTLLLAVALFSSHVGTEQTCFSPFLKNLGIGTIKMGFIFAVGVFVLGTSAFLSSRYTGKAGLLKLIACGLGISALGNVAFAFSGDFFWALLTRIVHDIGDGIFSVSFWLMIVEPFKIIERGRISGFGSFSSVAGMSSGALISGALADHLGFSFPFIAAASLEGIAALILIHPRYKSVTGIQERMS